MSAWEWPQWLWFCTICIACVGEIARNGKVENEPRNGALQITFILCEAVVLWFGGFWK